MRYVVAHRAVWAVAGALAIAVVVVKWTSGELDPTWVVRDTLIGTSSALTGIGFALWQRAKDEDLAAEVFAAKVARLHRETDMSR